MRISKVRTDWSTPAVAGSGNQLPGVGYRIMRIGGTATSVVLLCLCLLCARSAYGQSALGPESPEISHPEGCPDPPTQTSGSHIFRRAGETFDIPIGLSDCQPVSLVLRWSNGGNRGSLLNVTFLDNNNQPIYSRVVSVFLSGSLDLPLSSGDPQPWFAPASVVAVPVTVVLQTVPPFAYPAGISFTVTRKAARVRSKPRTERQPNSVSTNSPHVSNRLPVLDDQLAMKLRTTEGRLIAQGHGTWASANGESVRYKLKELKLPEPREMEIHGRRKPVEYAYRLTFSGAESRSSQGTSQIPALSRFGLIWLDDAALPAFSLDSQEISTLIYDRSVLREGAEIAVSNSDGSELYSLVDRLKYQPDDQSPAPRIKSESGARAATSNVPTAGEREEGNEVVSIRSAIRVIGVTRMPLVQIELRTNRPFPLRDGGLRLQIGKRFFLNELTGDHTGRLLTLTLTEEMFAELRDGAAIVAFFDKADRSGFAGGDIWHFGRLDKRSRQ